MADRCTWDGLIGMITSGGVSFTTNEKFDIGFAYDALYYEPAVGNLFLIYENQSRPLTVDEIVKINAYQETYIDTQDYAVWAYDSNNLYITELMKSAAIEKGYQYVMIGAPDHPASKLVNNQWVKIKMVVREDGTIVLDPAALCDLCMLGFTEEEYKALPTQPNINYRWDFTTSNWIDPRKLSEVKDRAVTTLKNIFDQLIAKEMNDFTPFRQVNTWAWQVSEAKEYLSATDPSKVKMPYLATFLEARTDQNKPTLKELCEDVLANHDKYLETAATLCAELWGYIKQVQSATTNDMIDAFLADIMPQLNSKTR